MCNLHCSLKSRTALYFMSERKRISYSVGGVVILGKRKQNKKQINHIFNQLLHALFEKTTDSDVGD